MDFGSGYDMDVEGEEALRELEAEGPARAPLSAAPAASTASPFPSPVAAPAASAPVTSAPGGSPGQTVSCGAPILQPAAPQPRAAPASTVSPFPSPVAVPQASTVSPFPSPVAVPAASAPVTSVLGGSAGSTASCCAPILQPTDPQPRRQKRPAPAAAASEAPAMPQPKRLRMRTKAAASSAYPVPTASAQPAAAPSARHAITDSAQSAAAASTSSAHVLSAHSAQAVVQGDGDDMPAELCEELGLTPEDQQAKRQAYLVTFPHTDKPGLVAPETLTRREIIEKMVDSFAHPIYRGAHAKDALSVDKVAIGREPHLKPGKDGKTHTHDHTAVLSTESGGFRFLPVKRALRERHRLASHWSPHHGYHSAVRCVITLSEKKPLSALDPSPECWAADGRHPPLFDAAQSQSRQPGTASRLSAIGA